MRDADLLRDYLKRNSETAFEELVRRYAGLVSSTAQRQVHDAHLAQDVTQTVFCLLARKAHNLTAEVSLAGWLYRATCFTAAKAMRTERRRQCREREALQMNHDGMKDID